MTHIWIQARNLSLFTVQFSSFLCQVNITDLSFNIWPKMNSSPMIHQNESSKTGSKNVRQSVRHFHQDGFSGQLLTNTQIKADKYRFLYWCHGIFLIVRPITQISMPSIATPKHCFWLYSYWILNVWVSLLRAWIFGIWALQFNSEMRDPHTRIGRVRYGARIPARGYDCKAMIGWNPSDLKS